LIIDISSNKKTKLMNNIINLNTVRHARLQERAKGVTLCGSGFHKWKIDTGSRFVRQETRGQALHFTRRGQVEILATWYS
jgi:hypothetical protein